MTNLSSPSSNPNFKIPFGEYLNHIIYIEKEDNTVQFLLDEEGNEVWQLNANEAQQVAVYLMQCAMLLKGELFEFYCTIDGMKCGRWVPARTMDEAFAKFKEVLRAEHPKIKFRGPKVFSQNRWRMIRVTRK